VARAGVTADPVVPPPPALRPYLGFARLTPRSLEAVARVVDRDDEFRARVVAAVDEDEVGRAGWLWLTRPDGWQAEVAEIAADAAAREDEKRDARAERSATKRLAAAQAAAARAEASATAALAQLEEVRAALAVAHERREAAEQQAAELTASVAELTAERSAAVRQLKEVEARLVQKSTELNATRARLREIGSDAAATGAAGRPGSSDEPAPRAPSVPPDPAGAPSSAAEPGPAVSEAPVTPVPAAPSTTGPVPGPGGPPASGDLAAELARAAEGAASLADGLAGLARLVATSTAAGQAVAGRPPPAGAPLGPPPADGSAAGAARDGPKVAGVPPARRVPRSLPGGVFDDSVEAAEHLLRTPGAVLIVDGYNVSMTAWPELPVADQRRRLVAALADLAARTATATEVVFDGAEVDTLSVPMPGRQLVRMRFSSPDIEADDVVIDMVGRLPAATPVIVASSDKRVREGARRGGANVLHAAQLVAVLRR
jgi:predicted RNA-binding protein with PIN domain